MTLSKRERVIVIITGVVVGLLALDRVVFTPWFEARASVATRLAEARAEMERAQQVFDNRRRADRRWAELAGQTLQSDAPAAEGQLLNALRDWAEQSGLSLSAVRPDRAPATHGFEQVTVRATGSGRMEQVARFLWNLDTSKVPVRITELQIASRQPGADDLTLQLAVSTIFLPPSASTGASR